RASGEGGGIAGTGRRARPEAGTALGWAAPARRIGTRDGTRAARVPLRRATLESRCQAAGGDARRAGETASAFVGDDRVRDARSGGGADPGEPRGGAARRSGGAGRPADGPVPLAGDAVCRRIR